MFFSKFKPQRAAELWRKATRGIFRSRCKTKGPFIPELASQEGWAKRTSGSPARSLESLFVGQRNEVHMIDEQRILPIPDELPAASIPTIPIEMDTEQRTGYHYTENESSGYIQPPAPDHAASIDEVSFSEKEFTELTHEPRSSRAISSPELYDESTIIRPSDLVTLPNIAHTNQDHGGSSGQPKSAANSREDKIISNITEDLLSLLPSPPSRPITIVQDEQIDLVAQTNDLNTQSTTSASLPGISTANDNRNGNKWNTQDSSPTSSLPTNKSARGVGAPKTNNFDAAPKVRPPRQLISEHPLVSVENDGLEAPPLLNTFTSTVSQDSDTLRACERYNAAIQKLKLSLKLAGNDWGLFDFPELEALREDQGQLLRSAIAEALKTTAESGQFTGRWSKTKGLVERLFTALSPFATNFLSVAQSAQSITNTELARKNEFETMLDYIHYQIGQLYVINDLPNSKVPSEAVINRALDVKTAVINHVAAHISHQTGHVARGFFLGDRGYDSSKLKVKTAVQEFNSALTHFGHSVGFKTFETVQGIYTVLESLSTMLGTRPSTLPPVLDYFIMPYEENMRFVGRRQLLQTLRNMLCEVLPQQYIHRVALFGLGGIGKTQSAIAYVYKYKSYYEQIYWISGESETSLLSGYQEIATRTPFARWASESEPRAVAKSVISWLRQQKSWLIIIDNLDHIELVKEYLPDRGLRKHTLITTRNPTPLGIPSRGLEVPLLDLEEGVELLCLLCDMNVDEHRTEAEEIVKELGYLPLALDQGASYINAVTKDFTSFLQDYRERQTELHRWIPDGNRQYSYSVANTWSLSFEFVKKGEPRAARLFQLLCLLNPDMVLLEFIVLGKEALEDDLRTVVSDFLALARALLSLERFSLVKWSRENKALSIHRLVQAVVRDEMPTNCLVAFMSTVVNMCNIVFSDDVSNETLALYRRHQSQVVGPLLRINKLPTKKTAEVIVRVADFLLDDGKFGDCEKLLLHALEIYSEISVAVAAPEMLKALADLAETYRAQGRWGKAVDELEKTLTMSRKLLGEDHYRTLGLMNNLGTTYRNQGRWDMATELLERTLIARRKVDGEEDDETLNTMTNLALTYWNQGRLDEAALLQEKTLLARRRTLGEDHTKTLRAMGNLGLTYLDQGRVHDTIELQERTLASRVNLFGQDHPETVRAMTNLAVTYWSQGNLSEAAALQEKALFTSVTLFGEDHHETLKAKGNLGVMVRDQGKLHEAIVLQESVLEASRCVRGVDHPGTLIMMCDLAETYSRIERWNEAIGLQEQVLETRKRLLGEQHSKTMNTAVVLLNMRNNQEQSQMMKDYNEPEVDLVTQ